MKSILRKSYLRQSKYGHILSTIIKISVDVIISSSSVTTYSVSLCVALNADNTKRLFYWIWRSLFFSFERSNTNKFRVFFESCLSSKLFYFPQNKLREYLHPWNVVTDRTKNCVRYDIWVDCSVVKLKCVTCSNSGIYCHLQLLRKSSPQQKRCTISLSCQEH